MKLETTMDRLHRILTSVPVSASISRVPPFSLCTKFINNFGGARHKDFWYSFSMKWDVSSESLITGGFGRFCVGTEVRHDLLQAGCVEQVSQDQAPSRSLGGMPEPRAAIGTIGATRPLWSVFPPYLLSLGVKVAA